MARHNNPTLTENCFRQFNTKNGDVIGAEIEENIVPVVIIDPPINIIQSLGGSTSGATIYTTPQDKDFYLTNASLSMAKDTATHTSIQQTLRVFVNGVANNILAISGITLTTNQATTTQNWGRPGIKIDRGTAITYTFTGTLSRIDATIQGYTVETTKLS